MPTDSKKYGVPDAENPEWTKEKFARSMTFSQLPADLQRVLSKGKRGPQKEPTKQLISIRLSHDVVEALRATGRGWQSRADEALRSWIADQQKSHS
ncbi:MAG TPA: BrnA antitoxin family protein [Acidobacteriaceae bacterium]